MKNGSTSDNLDDDKGSVGFMKDDERWNCGFDEEESPL